MSYSDKEIERLRYNNRARSINSEKYLKNKSMLGSDQVDIINRTPYIKYEEQIKKYVRECDAVLELGSGIGTHTYSLINTNAEITASDISESSIELIKHKFQNYSNLKVEIADIEALPFNNCNFDVVCCAGSLSYGNKIVVKDEIIRVLKPGGYLIVVDSLNNNPIYRLNRFIHYLKGNRTRSTLYNMPNTKLIDEYKENFLVTFLSFYGSIIWMSPFLSFFFNNIMISKIITKFDILINVKKSAFKFITVMRKNG
tara:strand:+ start:5048 stop:5815 length:768 start_codon:yes stop_codon:yes gene_type:complete